MTSLPKIYGYQDYRAYLSDFYNFKKKSKHGYSYRQFSQEAEFQSPNLLKLVIEGQRNLTSQSIEKFITALHLRGHQAAYFRALVSMNQAKNEAERSEYYNELQKLLPHSKKHHIDAEAFEYLSHWIYPVLRELVQLHDFRDDPHWIQRRLTGRIEISNIVKALQFLKKHELIGKNSLGHYFVKDEMVMTSDEIKNLAIRNYHRCALEQSLAALTDLPMEQREFGALIFQISEQSVPELKQRLKNFRQELHQWALDQQKAATQHTVIQLNLQMFPQTKKVSS